MESISSHAILDLINPNEEIRMNDLPHPGANFIRPRDNHSFPAPLQLSSPPNSASPSSPSPSTDISLSFINSPLMSTPVRRRVHSPYSGASSPTVNMDDIMSGYGGFCSPDTPPPPPPPPSLPFTIYDDEYHGQPSLEPDIPSSTNDIPSFTRDTSKRRADKSLSEDQRTTNTRRQRSISLIAVPTPNQSQQQLRNIHEVTGVEPPGQLLTDHGKDASQPLDPLPSDRGISMEQSSADQFWVGSPDDPPEDFSNKRMKKELRGKEGRNARTTSWDRIKPSLRRKSTGSMFRCMSLASHSDDTSSEITEQNEQEADQGESTINAEVSPEEGPNPDKESDTPTTRKAPRRKPLSDISFEVDVLPNGPIKSIELIKPLKEPTEPIEPITASHTTPFGPLMTGRPRKGSTRERLRIVNPFPMNPSYWNEYSSDTLNYLLEIEARYDRFIYMTSESDLGHNRMTLVNWLIEISYGLFGLQSATIHAAVNILDRYLCTRSKDPVHLDHLQGFGLCTLMIASKLEEDAFSITFPDCLRVCDMYSKRDLASMELAILVALKFEILVASATGFSDYFKRAIPDDHSVMELIDFLCDLSLTSHKFLDYNTSQIAASAMWIALCTVHQDWNEELAILTGYTRADMTPCSMIFKELVCSPIDTHLQTALCFRYKFDEKFDTLIKVLQ